MYLEWKSTIPRTSSFERFAMSKRSSKESLTDAFFFFAGRAESLPVGTSGSVTWVPPSDGVAKRDGGGGDWGALRLQADVLAISKRGKMGEERF